MRACSEEEQQGREQRSVGAKKDEAMAYRRLRHAEYDHAKEEKELRVKREGQLGNGSVRPTTVYARAREHPLCTSSSASLRFARRFLGGRRCGRCSGDKPVHQRYAITKAIIGENSPSCRNDFGRARVLHNERPGLEERVRQQMGEWRKRRELPHDQRANDLTDRPPSREQSESPLLLSVDKLQERSQCEGCCKKGGGRTDLEVHGAI